RRSADGGDLGQSLCFPVCHAEGGDACVAAHVVLEKGCLSLRPTRAESVVDGPLDNSRSPASGGALREGARVCAVYQTCLKGLDNCEPGIVKGRLRHLISFFARSPHW